MTIIKFFRPPIDHETSDKGPEHNCHIQNPRKKLNSSNNKITHLISKDYRTLPIYTASMNNFKNSFLRVHIVFVIIFFLIINPKYTLSKRNKVLMESSNIKSTPYVGYTIGEINNMVSLYIYGVDGLVNVTRQRINEIYASTNKIIGHLKIGELIDSVGDYAFSNHEDLQELDLNEAKDLRIIGKHSFEDTNIVNINLTNTNVVNLDDYAFAFCQSGVYLYPNAILERIGNYCFNGTFYIYYIKIPKALKELGDSPFFNKGQNQLTFEVEENLENFVYENNIFYSKDKSIIYYGGKYDQNTLALGINVKEIKPAAFAYVTIGSLSFNNNLQKIGNLAFFQTGLTSTNEIPSSVNEIGYGVFANTEMEKFYLVDSNKHYKLTSDGHAIITNDGQKFLCVSTHIGDTVVITIPDTVTSIEPYAFYQIDSSSVELKIPNKVSVIGQHAFDGYKAKNIIVGSGINSIGDFAFYGSHFDMPNQLLESAKSIGISAFEKQIQNKLVNFSLTDCKIGHAAFFFNPLINFVDFHSINTIPKLAFSSCINLRRVRFFNDDNIDIGEYAFMGSVIMFGFTITINKTNGMATLRSNSFDSCATNIQGSAKRMAIIINSNFLYVYPNCFSNTNAAIHFCGYDIYYPNGVKHPLEANNLIISVIPGFEGTMLSNFNYLTNENTCKFVNRTHTSEIIVDNVFSSCPSLEIIISSEINNAVTPSKEIMTAIVSSEEANTITTTKMHNIQSYNDIETQTQTKLMQDSSLNIILNITRTESIETSVIKVPPQIPTDSLSSGDNSLENDDPNSKVKMQIIIGAVAASVIVILASIILTIIIRRRKDSSTSTTIDGYELAVQELGKTTVVSTTMTTDEEGNNEHADEPVFIQDFNSEDNHNNQFDYQL